MTLASLAACAGLSANQANAATLLTGFTETQVFTGLTRPTRVVFAPDGRGFVLTQDGAVRIVKNGSLLATPFVTLVTNNSGERGVLGLEFDPGFATNRWVYIYYTATTPSIHNRVSRFTVSATNPDVVQSGSELVIFDSLPTLGDIYHNGGDIHISPLDGKLYIAVGDNKSSPVNPQSLTSLLGKILRINTDGSIPTDNPFYNSTTGAYRAIWARGLRNPFSFTIHPSTGTIYLNDVGESTWEEVNLGVKGGNYGWPDSEGPTTNPNFVSPLYSYNHSTGGCAIVGASLYTPANQQFPSSYAGKFFFADHCGKYIKTLDLNTKATATFASGMDNPAGVYVAPDGSVYYLTVNTGSLFQIKYSSAPSISQQPQNQLVTPGSVATFSVTAGGSTPLSYQWQRGTTNISGATSATYSFTAAAGDNGATFRCVVTNPFGSTPSNSATLTVTNNANPPVATITSPALNTTFKYGDTISYSGAATDAEDGTLAATALTWKVDILHGTDANAHNHTFTPPFSGTYASSFTIPLSGETDWDVWFRITLTATDSGGRTSTVTRDVFPHLSAITVTTNLPGLSVYLDGEGTPLAAPTSFLSAENLLRIINAPATQVVGGTTYRFLSWSDGGESLHDIYTPGADTVFTANYEVVTSGTPVLMEAENLARTSSGPVVTPKVDAAASNGNWLQFESTAVGNTLTFTTASLAAGTYEFRLGYKAFTARGQCSVKIDGTQVGSTLDQYSATAAFPVATMGTVTFATAGTHTIALQVTGKNAASTSYNLAADSFTFVPQVSGSSVEAPYYILPSNSYGEPLNVTLASNTAGALIRYTLDGSTPTATSGLLYTGPVAINATATLRSVAYSGSNTSAVTSATYTIAAAAPTFSPGASTNAIPDDYVYDGAQTVTIGSATSGASIRYTTDGSTPSATAGTLYSGPITVGATTTLKAVAYKTGLGTSNVTTATYTINGASAVTAEFETMTINASSGDATFVVADPVCSGGQWLKMTCDAVNDSITFSRVVNAGTYQIQVKIKSFTDRATVQLSTSGVAAGPFYNKDGPKDFYTAASAYGTVTYTALVTFPDTGTKYFRFTVTGKNAASTGYVIPLDALILTPQ